MVDAVLTEAQDGRRLRDQAVLMRTSHHSDLLEMELTARGVPFVKFGGLKFLEAAHVKDFVAVLRLLDNRLDEVAWYRLLRLHDGIGPARARALLDVLGVGTAARRQPPTTKPSAAAPAIARVGACRRLSMRCRRGRTNGIGDRGRRPPPPAPTAADRPLSGQRGAARRPRPTGRRRGQCSRPRRVRRGIDAGSARVHRRPRRTAAPGRRLPGAVNGALRQGAGVAGRARDPSGRRRLSGGHGAVHARRASSRSSGCSMWR